MLNVAHTQHTHLLAVGNEGFLLVSAPRHVGPGRLGWSWTILNHEAFTLQYVPVTSRQRLETPAFGLANEQQGIRALADLASFLIAAADEDDTTTFSVHALEWAQNNHDTLEMLTSDLADEIASF